ncbi:hypothetical protein [Amycolatopsis sp. MJM2582]|uniref:hypothetical protein n=1 Tax=Amycolatopsis sp. MJM2582 TaxID=1427749 RepID=UPI001269F03B|nr:hypothetical protein [Amycolatopsis sp. MJM2582]
MRIGKGFVPTVTIKLPADKLPEIYEIPVGAPGAVPTTTHESKFSRELRISATTVIERHRRKAR